MRGMIGDLVNHLMASKNSKRITFKNHNLVRQIIKIGFNFCSGQKEKTSET